MQRLMWLFIITLCAGCSSSTVKAPPVKVVSPAAGFLPVPPLAKMATPAVTVADLNASAKRIEDALKKFHEELAAIPPLKLEDLIPPELKKEVPEEIKLKELTSEPSYVSESPIRVIRDNYERRWKELFEKRLLQKRRTMTHRETSLRIEFVTVEDRKLCHAYLKLALIDFDKGPRHRVWLINQLTAQERQFEKR